MDPMVLWQALARKFVKATISRLMYLCPVFEQLQITEIGQMQEMASRLRLLNLEPGAKLPSGKNGMFIVLQGNLKATTHWKLGDGPGIQQQAYRSFVFKHLGKTD
jgi:hypothetical protein